MTIKVKYSLCQQGSVNGAPEDEQPCSEYQEMPEQYNPEKHLGDHEYRWYQDCIDPASQSKFDWCRKLYLEYNETWADVHSPNRPDLYPNAVWKECGKWDNGREPALWSCISVPGTDIEYVGYCGSYQNETEITDPETGETHEIDIEHRILECKEDPNCEPTYSYSDWEGLLLDIITVEKFDGEIVSDEIEQSYMFAHAAQILPDAGQGVWIASFDTHTVSDPVYDSNNHHPLVFIGSGSHAKYPRPGIRQEIWEEKTRTGGDHTNLNDKEYGFLLCKLVGGNGMELGDVCDLNPTLGDWAVRTYVDPNVQVCSPIPIPFFDDCLDINFDDCGTYEDLSPADVEFHCELAELTLGNGFRVLVGGDSTHKIVNLGEYDDFKCPRFTGFVSGQQANSLRVEPDSDYNLRRRFVPWISYIGGWGNMLDCEGCEPSSTPAMKDRCNRHAAIDPKWRPLDTGMCGGLSNVQAQDFTLQNSGFEAHTDLFDYVNRTLEISCPHEQENGALREIGEIVCRENDSECQWLKERAAIGCSLEVQ